MSFRWPLLHYFSFDLKREIAELYVSTAIADIALALVLVLEPIFLYTSIKLSITQILLFFGAVYFLYIFAIPFGAKIISLYGYEHGILFSIPFQILYWFFLFGSVENHGFLYLAPVAYAIQKALYWPALHASVTRFAQNGQRGREFSVLHAIVLLAQIVGPIIGGTLSDNFSIRMVFVIASAIYTTSFIPLFTTPEIFVPKLYKFRDTWQLYKTYPKKAIAYMGFGEEFIALIIWPVYIYIVVRDFERIGVLVTVATLVATVLNLYFGRLTDRMNKQTLIKWGVVGTFIVWLLRIFGQTLWPVFLFDTLARTVKDMVLIPLVTLTYERAEATHIMPYSVFFEQSLAIGKFFAFVLGAVIFTLLAGAWGMSAGFAGLFVLGGLFSLLYMLL